MTLITTLIEDCVMTEQENGRFQCICLARGKTIARSSIYAHVRSKQHRTTIDKCNRSCVQVRQQECIVCCEDELYFKTCNTCKHDVCIKCLSAMRKTLRRREGVRCPFCRTPYPERALQERVPVDGVRIQSVPVDGVRIQSVPVDGVRSGRDQELPTLERPRDNNADNGVSTQTIVNHAHELVVGSDHHATEILIEQMMYNLRHSVPRDPIQTMLESMFDQYI